MSGGGPGAPEVSAVPRPPRCTIYTLVRRDLPLPQQLVQAAHAAAEAGRSFYRLEHGIAHLVTLAVADAAELARAREHLAAARIEHAVFTETDVTDAAGATLGVTALATAPLPDTARRWFRRWPLWAAP